MGICTDPASRCLRRAPASLASQATAVAVSCGGAMVSFPLTAGLEAFLVSGAQASWLSLTPTVVAGTVANAPNTLWTGSGATNQSFIFARNQAAFGNTFASSYANNTSYSYCNGVLDAASLVGVFYR